jgi:EmrB/QacA subfamily drug resistance transporter
MLITDTTVVTVALPDLARGLGVSLAGQQWVLNIYTLVLAALALSAGSLADLIGQRRVFLGSVMVFGAASLVCGLAPSAAVLIAARAIQGLGGAAMVVAALSLLGANYGDKDRGFAFGTWMAVIGAAGAAGPFLGGVLTQYLSWRAIFFINLPLSLLTVILTAVFVRPAPTSSARPRIDISGMITFAIGSGALTYGLILAGGASGWTGAPTLACFAVAVVGLIVFGVIETRSSSPMLDLGLFRQASFVSVIACVIATSTIFACLVYASIWLQTALGLNPTQAGLALLPMAATSFVASMTAGKLLHKVPPRLAVGLGALLSAIGCVLVWLLADDNGSSWAALLPGLIVVGLGMGAAGPSTSAALMASAPPNRSGMASGTMATFRQLSQTLGVAVFGLVFAAFIESQSSSKVDVQGVVSANHVGSAFGIGHAMAGGLGAVFAVTGLLNLIACVLAFVFVRPATPPQTPPTAPAVQDESVTSTA